MAACAFARLPGALSDATGAVSIDVGVGPGPGPTGTAEGWGGGSVEDLVEVSVLGKAGPALGSLFAEVGMREFVSPSTIGAPAERTGLSVTVVPSPVAGS